MGVETYEDFWNYIPNGDESKVIEEGYKVYENRGIYEALKVAENLMNTDYAVPGTASMDHISAQARLLEGSSLFMVSGDWIYKEMELNYGKYLNDIVAIKNPVLSAVGVKLGLCGQTHAEPTFDRNNFVDTYACEDCEAKLRATIKAVDSGKSDAEVATEVGITATQAAEVRERRGYYQSCNGFAAMIPSYSNAKDVAKLFLRFLCSDDGIAIYNKNTHSNFIVKPVNAPDTTTMTAREKSLYDKIYGANTTALFNRSENPIRVVTSSTIFPAAGTTKLAYSQISYSHMDNKNPTYTAKTTYFDNVLVAQGNWGDWLAAAGLI
jgi:ABC-type glycerol-3-phosphate transport system substrate-binding protein